MSFSNGSGLFIFYRTMEMTRPLRKKMEVKVFVSHPSLDFLFVDDIIKVLLSTLYLDWAY